MTSHHRNIHQKDVVDAVNCQVCQKSFTSAKYLRQHMITHSTKEHRCPECDKSFAIEYYLKKHRVIHSNEKSFQCDLCDRSFRLKAYLTSHLRHHLVKDEACPQCQLRFITVKELESHMEKRHRSGNTSVNHFECDICGQNLTSASNLRTDFGCMRIIFT